MQFYEVSAYACNYEAHLYATESFTLRFAWSSLESSSVPDTGLHQQGCELASGKISSPLNLDPVEKRYVGDEEQEGRLLRPVRHDSIITFDYYVNGRPALSRNEAWNGKIDIGWTELSYCAERPFKSFENLMNEKRNWWNCFECDQN